MNELCNVGPGVKRLRQGRDCSRKVLSERAGVSLAAIYLWEGGESLPTFSVLSKVLTALGADRYDLLNAILGLEGEPRRIKLPARSGDHVFQREILDLLDLDLPPAYERAFLGMLGNLCDAFLAENPAPVKEGPPSA